MATVAFDFEAVSIGDILDRSARFYRRYFFRILKLALVAFPPTLLVSLWQGSVLDKGKAFQAFDSLLKWSLLFVALLWLAFVTGGALARCISETYLGKASGTWSSYRPLLRRSGSLVCEALASVLVWFGGVVLPVSAGAALLQASLMVGIIAATLCLATVLGALILACRITLVTVVIAIENIWWPAALRRSWRLIGGNSWRAGIVIIFSLALTFGPFLFTKVVSAVATPVPAMVEHVLLQFLSLFTSPLAAIALTLFYYDCRIRHEAFDLEMMAQTLAGPRGLSAAPVPAPAAPGPRQPGGASKVCPQCNAPIPLVRPNCPSCGSRVPFSPAG